MDLILHILDTALATCIDVLPIAAVLFGFQFLVIRKQPPNLNKVLFGFGYVLVGLTLFLVGLEQALFPIGETMAIQLTSADFIGRTAGEPLRAADYAWVYVFAAAVGFATTIAEPSLIAVALKAESISGGSLRALGLRIAVAIGVAAGVSLGSYRIISGTPIPYYIMAGYAIVIMITALSSRNIIPLAYDSGGVTTSTVTVPVVAALGLGLATTIPGRSALIDGFGLIAFAAPFAIMSVLGYALVTERFKRIAAGRRKDP